MMHWFGTAWNSAFCFDCPQTNTPVGHTCIHCDEKIAPEDTGIVYANGPVSHKNCFLAGIIGPLAHQMKQCSCFVPGAPPDYPETEGMTRRQQNDLAVALWEAEVMGNGSSTVQ
jgi:hypothetical protein